MKSITTMCKALIITGCLLSSGLTNGQQLESMKTEAASRFDTEAGAGAWLASFQSNNGGNLFLGYNFLFGDNTEDWEWHKVTLSTGINTSLEDNVYHVTGGYTFTKYLVGYRADVITSFSSGEMNLGINPKIGIDLMLIELYAGYNYYLKDDIPGLQNQVTFNANINFGWAFFLAK